MFELTINNAFFLFLILLITYPIFSYLTFFITKFLSPNFKKEISALLITILWILFLAILQFSNIFRIDDYKFNLFFYLLSYLVITILVYHKKPTIK